MIVGIDLGTTNSLIGRFDGTQPQLVRNPLGDYLTPSAVSLADDGTVIVGQAARERLVSHPDRTVANFKRLMGSASETRLGNRAFRPEELSALVLRALVQDAEAATGETVSEAIISVPAYFSDAQRKATRAAGALAGLKVEKLVNEPTTAALAYGLRERPDNSRFLVFDLGGGTFDVSILEMFAGVVEVHATAGDNFLGGEDFVDVLQGALARDCNIDPAALPPAQRGQLRRRLELAKRELSQAHSAEVRCRIGDRDLHWTIGAERFADLSRPLLERMRIPLERALRDAKLQADDLAEIILVGGATRMPIIPRLVSRMFGRLPLRHVDPDQAVALGASIAAGLKARAAALEETILTDVCPYSLGVEVTRTDDATGRRVNGFFSPIIQRNCTVPVSREDTFYPVTKNQHQLELKVFQGESPLTEHNILLGSLTLDVPFGVPTEQQGVVVRFTYDVNGVLQVEATVEHTGATRELLLQQNPGILDAAEIRTRLAALAALKIHPRERQENLAVLARAERLYAEHLALRDELEVWITRFRGAIESQDDHRIRVERTAIERAMERLETAP